MNPWHHNRGSSTRVFTLPPHRADREPHEWPIRAAVDAIAFWLARECDEIKSTFDVDLMRKTEKRGKT